jgi:hypothetical protein
MVPEALTKIKQIRYTESCASKTQGKHVYQVKISYKPYRVVSTDDS